MSSDEFDFIHPKDLRTGLFVSLDVGWMAHPFPSGSFKITTEKQIEILRSLGLSRVRYIPAKSDMPPIPGDVSESEKPVSLPSSPLASTTPVVVQAVDPSSVCERRFAEAAKQYQQVLAQLHTQPITAAQQCRTMINGLVAEIAGDGDVAVRLIKEGKSDRAAMHPVNVAVLCMLLGKAVGMAPPALNDLTLAAFLHDMGKVDLPPRVQWEVEGLTPAELNLHRNHVAAGVRIGKEMGLSNKVLQTIQQHHELADGSGYPANAKGEGIGQAARILALVNNYDGLCNPGQGAARLTPHEALARMFSQHKARFDGALLSVFIRMMGVYPPGSVVQLADDRYALVVSVNSSRPLKPQVIIFDPQVPSSEAPTVDLETLPGVGIRRSLKPSTLPDAVLAYLAPSTRLAYFFEPSLPQDRPETATSAP